jgi:hypothetical protein
MVFFIVFLILLCLFLQLSEFPFRDSKELVAQFRVRDAIYKVDFVPSSFLKHKFDFIVEKNLSVFVLKLAFNTFLYGTSFGE